MKHLLFTFFFLVLGVSIYAQEFEHNHSRHYALTENKGQWAEQVLFQSRSQGNNIWVQQHGFIYDIRDYSGIRKTHAGGKVDSTSAYFKGVLAGVELLGSNKVTAIEKSKPLSYYYNYFMGNKQKNWSSNVKSYQEVSLNEIYSGIDLKLFDEEARFKYEFWCAPGSDYKIIQLKMKGFEKISLQKNGDLVLSTPLGDIIEKKPVAFELLNGKLKEISCDFMVKNDVISFKLGNYNPSATLIIDPVLIFATYSGSITDNFGMTATYGYDGTVYSGGTIYGNSYPTPDPLAFNVTSNFTSVYNGVSTTDVFVSKYTADGTTMLWTGFLGGGDIFQGTETAHSLICDFSNNVYVFGITSSLDFPTTASALQTTHAGGSNINVSYNGAYFGSAGTDIYVAKISANGHTLMSSTYVGGTANDGINYKITSGNYSSAAAYDSLSTNYGDQFRGEIMIDSVGNCIVASCTRSSNFPTANAFQSTLGGQADGVIFKLNASMTSMQFGSYFGGANNDACYSVKIDSSQNIVFSGGTSSSDLPGTAGGLNPSYLGGKTDGFVGKLTPNGQTLLQSTYIGSSGYDQAFFVEINRNDEIFILGQTIGGSYPVVNASSYPNSTQFITKLNPSLTSIVNSFLFGNGNQNINISPAAFMVDICGNMYVSGWGGSVLAGGIPLTGMPVSSDAFMPSPANNFDFYLFVYKRDFSGLLYGSYLGGNQAQEHVDGGTSRFDKNGIVYQSVCGGCGGFSDFPTTPGAWSNQNLAANRCNNLVFKFDFELLPHAEFTTNDLLGCEDYTVTLNNTSSTSDSYEWDFGNGQTSSTEFSPVVTYTNPGIYSIMLKVTDSVCLLTDSLQITITVLPDVQLSTSNDTILCSTMPLSFTANSQGTASYFVWSSNAQFTDTLNTSVSDSILSVSPTETTTYYVQVGNSGCSKTDSVTVFFVGGSLSITGGNSICKFDTLNLQASINVPGVTFTFDWSQDSVIAPTAQQENVLAFPQSSQWIYVHANGSNGCFAEDSIYINVGNISGNISATANPEYVVPGNSSQLTANPPGYSYTWFPADNLSSSTGQTVSATPNQTQEYIVSITDGICTKAAKVKVNVVEILCDRTYVYVPNAFSPNGDTENDVLYVRSAIATKILFRIFDRWGELIFETKDQNIGWDGTYKGKMMKPDTYDYYLEATCVQGEQKIIKGNVTLIR